MSQTFVVVGGGLAAGKAVEELREAGFEGSVVVFGQEHHLPYERPPLSKGYLLGNDELESVFVHDPDWYDANDVDLRLGEEVTALDLDANLVHTRDRQQSYDRLLIATGATPRHLPLADDSGAPVAYLRTIEDSQRLKGAFTAGASIVVVGAGWIGLETAAAARAAGARVTVLESLELPLLRVLGPEVAGVFADLHREHGVDLRLGVQVSAVDKAPSTGSGEAPGRAVVRLADGSALEADLLVVGIGVTPNVALAEAAGLATDDGILVDEHLTTFHPAVFAAGDVANAVHPVLGRRLRIEHWDTAIEQGRTAAHSMLGHDVSYDRLPYFFTDQYDLGMEYVGNIGPEGYERVVIRGDTSEGGGRRFTAFWLRDDRVLAAMHANDWDASDDLRAIVGKQVEAHRLEDVSVSLEELAQA
jgi:3-phenylpropionate/trans-cinnamate dioxygenase ferredoxin reductase subunit